MNFFITSENSIINLSSVCTIKQTGEIYSIQFFNQSSCTISPEDFNKICNIFNPPKAVVKLKPITKKSKKK